MKQKILGSIRTFNKHIFNKFTLPLAKKGIGPYLVLLHQGRTSGRSYQTPLLATYVDQAIIIPLAYGKQVDWLRNVQAQDRCQLLYKR